MTSRFRSLVLAVAALSLVGCEGLRDALTAHTQTAARADRRQLKATHLADLAGSSRAPLRPDIVRMLADIWVDYQLLGIASARGERLDEPALVDSAMWSLMASAKAKMYFDRISSGWGKVDTAAAPAQYARGELLSASHLLLLTQNAPDSVKRAKLARIRALRGRATSANFAQLARDNSEDRNSAERGGSLSVFPRGSMVPQFESALLALQPGQISDVVETPYGFHIIRRATFNEIRAEFLEQSRVLSVARGESAYAAGVDSAAKVRLKKGAAARARAAALDFGAHRDDNETLATSTAGAFTSAQLVRWLETFPPQQQLTQRIQNAPDSAVEALIRNFVRNQLIIRAADSAGIKPPAEQVAQIRAGFVSAYQESLLRLGLDPASLADSGRTLEQREDLAARRVDDYLRAMLADRAPYVQILPQLQWALRSKYKSGVSPAGTDNALQLAVRVRAVADSARAAQQPSSVVPLPGGGPANPAASAPAPAPSDTTRR